MAVIYTDFVSGTLTAGISNSAATFTSSGLTSLSAIGGSDIAKIVIDPFASTGAPEIVYVTAHTAASNTVTGVQRGQEGTLARTHNAGELIMNVPTSGDFRDIRTGLANFTSSPGTAMATGAPTDLAAGGAAQTGTSIAVSRSDHRHALPAGTPGTSAPSDAAADGTATTVARSDHKHAREAFATTTAAVGTAAAPGTATTVVRGDHVHVLGAGALSATSQIGSSIEVTTICTSGTRPAHAKGRMIVETDTSRRYESDGTNWLRRETLLTGNNQTGITMTAAQSISNNSLTRFTALTTSHDSDSYRVDGQYTRIPPGLAGVYLATWDAVMNDGSAPNWLEVQFALDTTFNGVGVSKAYTAHNGTVSKMANGTKLLTLVANQIFVINAIQANNFGGTTKQVNITVDLTLLKNTGP